MYPSTVCSFLPYKPKLKKQKFRKTTNSQDSSSTSSSDDSSSVSSNHSAEEGIGSVSVHSDNES